MSKNHLPDREPEADFDWSQPDGPTQSLLLALSEVLDGDMTDAEPLYHYVNVDALETLFAPTPNPHERLTGSVRFQYRGHLIIINATGRGYIYEQPEFAQAEAALAPAQGSSD